MRIAVRQALHSDTDWLVTQLKAFSRFADTKLQLFGDESHARLTIGGLIESQIVFVAEKGSTLLGFIAGYVVDHPFNPKIKTLSETFWWVAEEHRGSRAALLLFKAFTDWGKKNVDWICMALEAKSPVNDSALIKRGFRLQERSFLMECV